MKNKLFKAITTFALTVVLVFSVIGVVSADGQTCVTQYGGAVVCGNTPPEVPHVPVKAGLGDINFGVVGGILLIGSSLLFVYSKRNSLAH
jgi:hypothetical protein